MSRVRILLVDDQILFRQGVRTLLELQSDFEVVGEAGDGKAAVEQAAALRPGVVLMDLRMPGMNGTVATGELLKVSPESKVLVLTTFEEDAEVFAALRAGAIGYLLKATPAQILFEGVRHAARGESVLNPSVAARVVAEFARLAKAPPATASSRPAWFEGLSCREADVLKGLARGLSNKEIGQLLGITEGTVKNHMSAVMAKLGVLDRTQAALRAREWGLL